MLLSFSKKICPMLSLALLTINCGKKINDPEVSDNNGSSQNLIPDGDLTLEINFKNSYFKSYEVQYNGWFSFPDRLQIAQGNGIGMKVSITYNLDKYEDYEYRCYYETIGNAKEMTFDKCVNGDEQNLLTDASKLNTLQFIQDKGKHIVMKLLTEPQEELVIRSSYSVDWKIVD